MIGFIGIVSMGFPILTLEFGMTPESNAKQRRLKALSLQAFLM